MPTLFSRKAADPVIETVEPEEIEPVRRNYTPSKRELGVVTPKRTSSNQRRNVKAMPMDKAEAKVARRRQANERRAAMMAGEEWALADRDRGPEKRLVRDIVDSRRNLAEFLFFGIIGLMVLSIVAGGNAALAVDLEFAALILLIPVVIDCVILSRKAKRLVQQKFPKSNVRGLGRYAITRAASTRRMRVPRPQVERGAALKI